MKNYSFHTRVSGSIIVRADNKKEALIKINKALSKAIEKDIEDKATLKDVFVYPAI